MTNIEWCFIHKRYHATRLTNKLKSLRTKSLNGKLEARIFCAEVKLNAITEILFKKTNNITGD